MQIEISDTFYEELKKYMEICEENDLSGFVNKALKRLYSSSCETGCGNEYQLKLDINKATWDPENTVFNTSYLCIDIDNFKGYMDVNGLRAGDELLFKTGEALKELYPSLPVYRIEGDSFVVELKNTPFIHLKNIGGVKFKHSIVHISVLRNKKRNHRINGRIFFNILKGILYATEEGTEINYTYPEKKNTINHMTFSVSDLNKSIEFYRNVLEANLLVKGEKLAYFDLNGLWIALNIQKDIKRNEIKESYSHISFSIDEKDYEEILVKLKNLDVKILEGRQRHTDEGRSIYFEDPDGHKFEFHTGTKEDRINYYKKSRKDFTFYQT